MPRLAKVLSFALPAGAGLLVWRIFFPALMSFDSFTQYRQAWVGQYDDWHPPLMAIVLHQCFRLGHGVGMVTFVQCVAGVLGVRALAAAWLAAAFRRPVSPGWADGIAAGVALLMVLPMSPLPFYLATFWKDSWAAVLLLWICALSLRLLAAAPDDPDDPDDPRRTWFRAGALVVLAVLLGLVRHNAIVVLPFAGLVLAAALWRRSRGAAAPLALAVLALAPLLLALAGERAIDRIFDVKPRHLERLMMVFDLAGVCAEDERICSELPYTRGHSGGGDLARRYKPGDMGGSFPKGILVRDEDAATLRAEYLRVVRRFPGALARVKVEAFAPLLDPTGARMVVYRGLDGNEFGLQLNPRFAAVREWLGRAVLWAGERNPVVRPLVGSHLVWLALNVVLIALLLVAPGRRRLALALLIPLAFYLSYLLATPEPDYRFLAPSTFAIQCLTLASALGYLAGWLAQKPTGRAP
ncbi:MAG TPA: hypothetical protein VGG20_29280 [Thermoanaerobaculia bacterium]|jgi:hypothetical protein